MKMPLNVHREAIALYPSAEAVMDSIIPNYVTGIVYGALVEAYASEHNARNDGDEICDRQCEKSDP